MLKINVRFRNDIEYNTVFNIYRVCVLSKAFIIDHFEQKMSTFETRIAVVQSYHSSAGSKPGAFSNFLALAKI